MVRVEVVNDAGHLFVKLEPSNIPLAVLVLEAKIPEQRKEGWAKRILSSSCKSSNVSNLGLATKQTFD